MKLIDVIYLARGVDWGLNAAKTFIESYKKHPAGYPHHLIIAAKAWNTMPEEYQELKRLAEELNAIVIDLPDDGFEFTAYYRCALNLHSDFILCMTSSSVIQADNWLEKFAQKINDNKLLKMIGTCGSWAPTPKYDMIEWSQLKKQYTKKDLKYYYDKYLYKIKCLLQYIKYKNQFSNFPNYHIRTNAFIIDRNLYIEYFNQKHKPKTKMDCYCYESGKFSLTNYICSNNYKLGILGKDNILYNKKDWNKSRTFCAQDTSNIIIRDKYDTYFKNLSSIKRCIYEKIIWGEYLTQINKTNIKFSILIPTRDRLDLLKYAISSVLNQTYDNWEIIVSDNYSKDSIEDYINSLNEPRIKYIRQEEPVSVTDNWNTANDAASGDYIIMLGDDDALLPDTLEKFVKYLNEYEFPDLLNFAAYIYTQPQTSPLHPEARLYNTKAAPYIKEHSLPFILSFKERCELLKASLDFNFKFGFNMQYFLYSRDLIIKTLKYGKFYEPPYPDYYTANVFMILAERILVIPDNLVIIGITPKSYGCYYQNNNEKEGMKFHNESDYRKYAPKSVRNKLLNIAEMQTAAMATFALIAKRFPEYAKLNIKAYYKAVIRRIFNDYPKDEAIKILTKELLPKAGLLHYFSYKKRIKKISEDYTQEYFSQKQNNEEKYIVPYQNIDEVISALYSPSLSTGE